MNIIWKEKFVMLEDWKLKIYENCIVGYAYSEFKPLSEKYGLRLFLVIERHGLYHFIPFRKCKSEYCYDIHETIEKFYAEPLSYYIEENKKLIQEKMLVKKTN